MVEATAWVTATEVCNFPVPHAVYVCYEFFTLKRSLTHFRQILVVPTLLPQHFVLASKSP